MPATRTTAAAQTDDRGTAADLARTLHRSGWSLTGASVRVIHTARLSDESGLNVTISSEAGRVRLDFDSEYRHMDGVGSRSAWHAQTTGALSGPVLAAVASANVIAFDGTDGAEIAELLAAGGWQRSNTLERAWASPDSTREVVREDEITTTELPWEIRFRSGPPLTVYASSDTPPAVIAAFALTDFA